MSEEGRSDATQQVRDAAFDPPAGVNHLANGIALAILNAIVEGRDRQAIESQLLQNFKVSAGVLRVCITAIEKQLRRHDEYRRMWPQHDAAPAD
jgi:hypothetical protein